MLDVNADWSQAFHASCLEVCVPLGDWSRNLWPVNRSWFRPCPGWTFMWRWNASLVLCRSARCELVRLVMWFSCGFHMFHQGESSWRSTKPPSTRVTRVHLCERQVACLALSEADGCSAKNMFLRVVSCVVTVISQLLLVLARAALA